MLIRPAVASDAAAIAAVIMPTIRDGSTYALDATMTEADALAYWLAPDRDTFVADDSGTIVGTYFLRANQAGGGRHVCNAGYVTATGATGRGIARRMCEHLPTQRPRARLPRDAVQLRGQHEHARRRAVGVARLHNRRPPPRRVPSPARATSTRS